MKLLILTQTIDHEDSVLGFMHEWLRVFAEHVSIIAICLNKGKANLDMPVYSLGKEEKQSRMMYVWRFFVYIWRLRKEYDGVYVHMNKEYVLLGALCWKLMGKKIVFSYNHPYADWKAKLAFRLADTLFYTSPFAASAGYSHTKQMSAGINTDHFQRDEGVVRQKKTIFTIARISPVKYIDVLIEGFERAYEKDADLQLHIFGDAPERDQDYLKQIQKQILESPAKDAIVLHGGVPNYKTPEIYNTYDLFVNLTPTGSLDKTTLEAMACETPVLVSNEAFRDILPERLHEGALFLEGSVVSLARKITDFYEEDQGGFGKELRECILAKYSVEATVETILDEY